MKNNEYFSQIILLFNRNAIKIFSLVQRMEKKY